MIKTFAQLYGRELHVLSVNSALDTIEILGGFEQVINQVIVINYFSYIKSMFLGRL